MPFADRRIAARASGKGLGEGDDEAPSDCRDRVGDVPLGSDRRRLWVGNRWEWQIPRAARRNVALRGDGASFGDQKPYIWSAVVAHSLVLFARLKLA